MMLNASNWITSAETTISAHYSTTRSALTTFLITVALTLFAAYFSTSYPPHLRFFSAVAKVVMLAALGVCLVFSYRTERARLYRRNLWEWSKQRGKYPVKSDVKLRSVWKGMALDSMNWALLAMVGFTVFFFT